MTRSRRIDFMAAGLLVLAFAASGWHIARRPPASDFAAAPVASTAVASMAASTPASAPNLPPPQLSPDGRWRFDAGFVSSSPGKAVHAASLVELLDGRLRAVWFSGSREGAGDVTVQTAVMDAASQRWSAETTLFDRQALQRGLWRYVKKIGNPVIARAPDGSLWLWMVNVSLGGWAGSSITWARSTDEGFNWSPPRRLVTSPFLNISTLVKGAPIFYQNGEIGLPVYHELMAKFAEVLRLSPDGQVLDKLRIPASHGSLQPVLLVAGPQQAQAYMRSGQSTALMMSQTHDAGQTWSATAATAWPNPDSAMAGVVTSGGQQWLALNPGENRGTLALLRTGAGGSFDGASPWLVEASPVAGGRLSVAQHDQRLSDELRAQGASLTQIEADVASARRQLCGAEICALEYSYPYLLQSRDGYLHLVYTWQRSRIKHVRLDPLQRPPTAEISAPNHAPAAH
ncbi:MAG: exo-alpha-sialidase [Polaromonas sp.]